MRTKDHMALKTSICEALKEDISNSERQTLKELFSLVDVIILDKFGEIGQGDYDNLYRELTSKLTKDPKDIEVKILYERLRSAKNVGISKESFIYMKLLLIKLILEGYGNTSKVVKFINNISTFYNKGDND